VLWVGDGTAPAGPHLVRAPVDFHMRRGVVVIVSASTVCVEGVEGNKGTRGPVLSTSTR